MLKKPITYTDYNGNERTEDFYFNLSKAEVMELEMSVNGGLAAMYNRIIAAQDNATLIAEFKKLILMSYGEKSLDGKHFVKSEELSNAFAQTEAYSNLFWELATNTDAASEFVNGIMPANLDEDIKKELSRQGVAPTNN